MEEAALKEKRKRILSDIAKYENHPYYETLIPRLEKELEYVERQLVRFLAVKEQTKEAAQTIVNADKLDTGLPRYEYKQRGMVIQRIGPVPLRDVKHKVKEWFELVMVVVKNPSTGKIHRICYVKVGPSFDSSLDVQNTAMLGFANLMEFVNNFFRCGPLTDSTINRLHLYHKDFWDKHGNHKVLNKHQIKVKLF